MPVKTCTKDGKSGHKWGDQGVCFIGPGSEDKAKAVGRAIAAKEDEVEKEEIKKTILEVLKEFFTKDDHTHDDDDKKKKKKKKVSRKPDAGKNISDDDDTPIIKSLDGDKRLITGVVLQPEIVDAHGDVISKEEIEETALNFMEFHQTIGKQHAEKADAVPVESFLLREDSIIGGELVTKGSWVMTVKVLDDELWEEAKDGKFTGFSIGGFAETEDL